MWRGGGTNVVYAAIQRPMTAEPIEIFAAWLSDQELDDKIKIPLKESEENVDVNLVVQ